MSLRRFLTRLIWLCLGPLVLLAIFLAVANIMSKHDERDVAAANLVNIFAAEIDQHLQARISALHMLAASPLVDDAARWNELYREARGFYSGFGSHVILADSAMHMLFNTRVPFGTSLPPLPRPRGRAAAPTALATGRPAVGNIFFGPLAREPLVAIAVPALRRGKTDYLLLTIFATRQFQDRLDRVRLPRAWSLAVLDGNGDAIASRNRPAPDAARNAADSHLFTIRSAVSDWSVVLGIPHDIYSAELLKTGAALGITIVIVILVSLLGGIMVSRRLAKAVAALTETPAPAAPPPEIAEIASVRRLLDETAEKRRQTEEALRISEEKYRTVADFTYDWETWVDAGNNFVYISPSCERIAGYPPGAFLQNPQLMTEITHPADREATRKHFTENIYDPAACHLDFRIIARSGAEVWISHFCRPIYDSAGKFIGRRGSNRDITERKHAEEEIRALNEELEQRVADRTARLVAVNRELESFSYSVSHDLRAPLRSIAGFSRILLEDCAAALDERGRKYLERMERAVGRMSMLIEDMLKLTRVARAEFASSLVDLSGLVADVAEIHRQNNPRHNVDLTIQNGVTVLGDKNLLRIALTNLLENAWKYTGHTGQPRIEYGALTKDGYDVHFIRDNGAGFDMANADRLFQAFERLHAADEFPGTGIGLATVKRVINLHGGKIWAEGAVGKGATFFFTLPGGAPGPNIG